MSAEGEAGVDGVLLLGLKVALTVGTAEGGEADALVKGLGVVPAEEAAVEVAAGLEGRPALPPAVGAAGGGGAPVEAPEGGRGGNSESGKAPPINPLMSPPRRPISESSASMTGCCAR